MLQYKRAATEHDAKATKAQDIKKGGLDALLGSLQQAKKVNVLDKSRMDWGDFKSSDVKVSKSQEENAAVCLAWCCLACRMFTTTEFQHREIVYGVSDCQHTGKLCP